MPAYLTGRAGDTEEDISRKDGSRFSSTQYTPLLSTFYQENKHTKIVTNTYRTLAGNPPDQSLPLPLDNTKQIYTRYTPLFQIDPAYSYTHQPPSTRPPSMRTLKAFATPLSACRHPPTHRSLGVTKSQPYPPPPPPARPSTASKARIRPSRDSALRPPHRPQRQPPPHPRRRTSPCSARTCRRPPLRPRGGGRRTR